MAHTNYTPADDTFPGTCDASSAIQIALVQANEDRKELATVSTIAPEYTHAIFGQDESIFGYKGLVIKLRFAAHDLRPHLHISYDDRFREIDDTKAVDLNETLRPFLSEESFKPFAEYTKAMLQDECAKQFKPPGRLLETFVTKERTYEVWAGSLADPNVRNLFDRIQILIPFFIDGGQLIETNDVEWTLRRWTIYFLYEKIKPTVDHLPTYSFAGFATTYRWYFYHRRSTEKPKPTDGPFPFSGELQLEELPSRLRIAQFLILQPHQRMGNGPHLYRIIQAVSLEDTNIHELTVEDPNEDFDNLRDANDYRLVKPEFQKLNLKINDTPYPAEMKKRPRYMPTAKLIPPQQLEQMRVRFKLTRNQFAHVLEMYLLSQIPPSNRGARTNMTRLLMRKWKATSEHERRYYWWRMLVKQRLYKKHRDLFIQTEPEERLEALETTLNTVEEGYEQTLLKLDVRDVHVEQERLASDTQETDGSKARNVRDAKRKVMSDEKEGGETEEGEKTKKVRM
ncbi:histone acetyltransferase 1 [Ascosphaera aggregata]|nr:histone acetyltransferase 1 [Ascosphaera aggregata]